MVNRTVIAVSVTAAVVGAALVVGLSVGLTRNKGQPESEGTRPGPRFNPAGSPLDFFGVDDGLKLNWYHGTNSKAQLKEALEGNYQMLEGDITLRWYGFPNQTEEPIMAHPPLVDSDNTLDNWLVSIFASTDKGLKLDFKSEEVMEPSLILLRSKEEMVNHSVWANADIVRGPNTLSKPKNATVFIGLVNKYFPNMTLSLGWTTGCCFFPFDREMMEEMYDIARDLPQPVSFPARAALLKESWAEFKWLLMHNTDRFSISLWTPAGANDWEGATPYDLLYVRNDCDKKLIYYDLPGPQYEEFKQLSVTAGTPLNHFPLTARDAIHITWAHAVNSQQELDDALNSDVMMLEADVTLRGQGTDNETDIPIMAHPPATDSDINLDEWLTRVLVTNKGIKLDMKFVNVLEPTMKVLEQHRGKYNQPVWLNSDIFQGPNSASLGVDAAEFRRIVLQYFPQATLSIGWTTSWPGSETYTPTMVEKMSNYSRDLQQPITYPVRAIFAWDSWNELKSLLDQSRSHTFTIWSGTTDLVDPDDLVKVRQNSEIERIFYDLPEWLMERFLEKLNMTSATQLYV